ncbi:MULTISPECIES: invasion associated locus B family protein [Sulfitobacter]|uniref:invasion associated locus B family protein n=1 Tax=Sulfitobacter TaxID=60136 RepID=UPI002307D0A9|nr:MULTISPECIES: invasion associated locus B family protein [Sulfitobacter]MDF3384202.1 invasion associated locus B family protein [Sulfitobacter sp. Ks11]MDF3387620.1 invasion associated locus B family protein [Sulfitobacter sp. M85]MDF3391040.1 invasion associated locus B family protein [Sulfitobacter sp. Ks16]MDF3401678.1 invasion associated locus B family protein [Sulfitobacter sp. KE39]MDF3405099.1 invasion associated locus B family protein [Sulfitobacter sp. Ks35]
MSKFMTALPLCAALALTAPMTAFAQTATEEDTAQTEEQQPQPGTSGNASQIEEQLSLGEDADKDPELGKPYTKKEIGSWEMRCIKTEEEVDPCQMYQLLADGEGAPVAEVSLFRLPDGGQAKAGATVVVPLETALPAQLTLSVDGGKARRYPYAFCNPVGCYVRMGLTDADIGAFKRGKEAVLTIVPALAPDQEVKLTLSLDGFTASYDEVSVIEQ